MSGHEDPWVLQYRVTDGRDGPILAEDSDEALPPSAPTPEDYDDPAELLGDVCEWAASIYDGVIHVYVYDANETHERSVDCE